MKGIFFSMPIIELGLEKSSIVEHLYTGAIDVRHVKNIVEKALEQTGYKTDLDTINFVDQNGKLYAKGFAMPIEKFNFSFV